MQIKNVEPLCSFTNFSGAKVCISGGRIKVYFFDRDQSIQQFDALCIKHKHPVLLFCLMAMCVKHVRQYNTNAKTALEGTMKTLFSSFRTLKMLAKMLAI